jgi:hypothetical protein
MFLEVYKQVPSKKESTGSPVLRVKISRKEIVWILVIKAAVLV